MTSDNIRGQFPFFPKHPELIYFDSSSSTLKPLRVSERVRTYLAEESVNINRGNYDLAVKIQKEIEQVRSKVASFLGASETDNVYFTSGSSANSDFVAINWGLKNLKDGDEILYSPFDHKSTIRPWLKLAGILKTFNVNIKLVPYNVCQTGDADENDIFTKITPRTKAIIITHIHNVFGARSDIELIRNSINPQIMLYVDAAQSASRVPINVQKLGADFLSLSGSKLFASTGTGVLWVSHRQRQNCPELEEIEVGTINIAGVLSLGPALDFISEVSINYIENRLLDLSQYALNKLRKVNGIEFLPGIAYCKCATGYGIISFKVAGITPTDLGFVLSDKNILVRAGNHCSNSADINDSIRLSLHVYNTQTEIDILASALEQIIN